MLQKIVRIKTKKYGIQATGVLTQGSGRNSQGDVGREVLEQLWSRPNQHRCQGEQCAMYLQVMLLQACASCLGQILMAFSQLILFSVDCCPQEALPCPMTQLLPGVIVTLPEGPTVSLYSQCAFMSFKSGKQLGKVKAKAPISPIPLNIKGVWGDPCWGKSITQGNLFLHLKQRLVDS